MASSINCAIELLLTWKRTQGFVCSCVDAIGGQLANFVVEELLDVILEDSIKQVIQPTVECKVGLRTSSDSLFEMACKIGYC